MARSPGSLQVQLTALPFLPAGLSQSLLVLLRGSWFAPLPDPRRAPSVPPAALPSETAGLFLPSPACRWLRFSFLPRSDGQPSQNTSNFFISRNFSKLQKSLVVLTASAFEA